MNTQQPECIYCKLSSEDIPLIPFEYRGKQHFICPQHLPILIHKPAQLADKLPGLEKLAGAEGHEH